MILDNIFLWKPGKNGFRLTGRIFFYSLYSQDIAPSGYHLFCSLKILSYWKNFNSLRRWQNIPWTFAWKMAEDKKYIYKILFLFLTLSLVHIVIAFLPGCTGRNMMWTIFFFKFWIVEFTYSKIILYVILESRNWQKKTKKLSAKKK